MISIQARPHLRYNSRSRRRIALDLFASALILGFWTSEIANAADDVKSEWQIVKSPEVWKSPPKGKQGYGWYRSFVTIPESWKTRDFEFFAEPVDDAREFYINGVKVGGVGSFPPEFRSGLGDPDRHLVASSVIQPGKPNVVAIRVYDSDGRGGFNVAAPVLFAGDEAIRLEGAWQFRPGDNPDWARLSNDKPAAETTFAKIQKAAEIAKTLRKLPGDDGPLNPDEALKRFKTSDGLVAELALSEPQVAQPLSLKFDERGRMWVVHYLQYPTPAGLKMISRDKFLRSVYDKTPAPPPNHFRGADKITVHEDSDGDGKFDKHSTFLDGLSLASSFEFDRDGVWVLNPPYLLFYRDENHDDVPDGDPEVHLEGFGLEDSHSITNNLRWGPDGWLYASQGSTVTGHIKRFGSKDPPVHSMGQLIWRYQPQQRRYEIFAEGGGNSFGVEFDSKGRVYSGHNGGDTRGFHYVQGGYYQKGFGKHGSLSNPYSFGYFPMMAHHSVPRFTHAFVIYEGGALGSAYEGKLFGVAPLSSHVIYSQISSQGSTFKTTDIGHALSTNDNWCRPVDIQVGPDGALYVADMYEQRIDHASHYQGRIDRDNGRIYRLKANGATALPTFDLAKRKTAELVDTLRHENKWYRQTALRLLAQRQDQEAIPVLAKLLFSNHGQLALECLWALRACGGFNEEMAIRATKHEDPYVRLWSVRIVCDEKQASPKFGEAMADLAYRDPHVEVRSQLACSAARLPAALCLPICRNLLARGEDVTDPHVPLLVWWAIESKAETDREAIVSLLQSPEIWNQPLVKQFILERLMRRYAQSGSQKDLLVCARLLEHAPADEHVKLLMTGFEKAYEGRPLLGLPEALAVAMAKRGGGSLGLRLRQSEPQAITESLRIVADVNGKKADRLLYLQILGQVHPAGGLEALLRIVEESKDEDIRTTAMTALQSYDDGLVGTRMVRMFPQFPAAAREVAQSLLASRPAWTKELLRAVDEGSVPRETLPLAIVRRMTLHRDEAIAELVRKLWGEIQGTNAAELRQQIERMEGVIASGTGNPYKGRALFQGSCGKCHVLFDDGGKIGPDLTAYKRDDLATMLVNIVNPSLQVREGFETFLVFTDDGRALNGFISDQDNQVVVLRTADGQTLVISREEIDEMRASPQSIMPEGLLHHLQEQQVRDLFAYLRATQPLPD